MIAFNILRCEFFVPFRSTSLLTHISLKVTMFLTIYYHFTECITSYREGGGERGRKGGGERGREGEREGGRKGGREREREGEREGGGEREERVREGGGGRKEEERESL